MMKETKCFHNRNNQRNQTIFRRPMVTKSFLQQHLTLAQSIWEVVAVAVAVIVIETSVAAVTTTVPIIEILYDSFHVPPPCLLVLVRVAVEVVVVEQQARVAPR